MKKVFVLMLALAGVAPLYAQLIQVNKQSKTEMIFDQPRPGALRNNFDFLLPKGGQMKLEFSTITQLESLVDVDSLIKKVWQELTPLHDSLMKPLVSRRIDFIPGEKGPQFRILEYPQKGTTYKYIGDELVQTKLEQDTLRIRLYSTPYLSVGPVPRPYFVTLILNNIADISTLPEGILNTAVEMLKKDVAPSLAKKQTQSYRVYYAIYDVNRQKRISPVKNNYFGYAKDKYWEPYIQLGIQYVRGSWAPSSGVGMQWIHGSYNNSGNREVFKLYWEPYFFFSRSASNNLITERNDFITFKYNEVRQRPNNFPTVYLNFSAGYLISRKGNWFEPTSFKFAVPGYALRNVVIEPEFHFNKLFRNFTPSLRLTLEIE